MAKPGDSADGTWWSRTLRLYRESLRAVVRSPAVWFFFGVWLLAVAYLSLGGFASLLRESAIYSTLTLVVFGLLTIPLTAKVPEPAYLKAPPTSQGRLWAQVGVLLVVVLLTGYRDMVFNHALPRSLSSLPLWTPLVDLLDRLWSGILPNPFLGVTPTLYVLVPGALLLALGARPRELGFARGYRALRVAALWSAIQLVLIAVALVSARLTLLSLVGTLVSNFFQNGFSEEFLFRGALMTRLARLLGNSWAVVLSSLLFGLWHLGTNTTSAGGSYLAGAALGIVSQAVFGLGVAFVFVRTRNLLAPTIIHILADINV
jgi:membrane protease YdiL (CAAX protease family)